MEKKPTRLFNIAICLVVVLLSAAAVGVVVGVTLASRAADAINTTVVYNPPGAPPMPPMLPGMTSYEGSTMLAYFIAAPALLQALRSNSATLADQHGPRLQRSPPAVSSWSWSLPWTS